MSGVQISDILRHKGGDVLSIAPSAEVTELLARLAEHDIGALLVCDNDEVVGIVSERDVVRRLARSGGSVLQATVGELMTEAVHTCTSQDTVDSVAQTMTAHRIRHVPVIDDGTLVGVVSIGDVVSSRMRQLEMERGQLEQYISG